ESEALRYLKIGAKGIIGKTTDIGTFLCCLESVAEGSTWMEDSLFREAGGYQRATRTDLTRREQEVLELVEQGLRNKEIAAELGIRPGTVKIHLKHIFEKTGVRGRYGLALNGLRDRGSLSLTRSIRYAQHLAVRSRRRPLLHWSADGRTRAPRTADQAGQ